MICAYLQQPVPERVILVIDWHEISLFFYFGFFFTHSVSILCDMVMVNVFVAFNSNVNGTFWSCRKLMLVMHPIGQMNQIRLSTKKSRQEHCSTRRFSFFCTFRLNCLYNKFIGRGGAQVFTDSLFYGKRLSNHSSYKNVTFITDGKVYFLAYINQKH